MRRRNLAIGVAFGTAVLVVGLLMIYWPSSPCSLQPSCQSSPYFVRATILALPFIGMGVDAVSLAGLALSLSHVNVTHGAKPAGSRFSQFFVALLASASIFLGMFVVIHGLLFSEVQAIYSPPLWTGVMYAPYLAIGAASLTRRQRGFGLTLILMGLIAAYAFYGFVDFN